VVINAPGKILGKGGERRGRRGKGRDKYITSTCGVVGTSAQNIPQTYVIINVPDN
jgi:hypothetical protein